MKEHVRLKLKNSLRREQVFLDGLLPEIPGETALIVGCDHNESFEAHGTLKYCYYASGFVSSEEAYGTQFSAKYWPFKENTFDVIFLYHALPFSGKLPQLLTQAYHCLTKGGTLVIVDFHPSLSGLKMMKTFRQKRHHYTYSYLNQILVENNFAMVEVHNFGPNENVVYDWFYKFAPSTATSFVGAFKKVSFPMSPFELHEATSLVTKGRYIPSSSASGQINLKEQLSCQSQK